MVNTWGNSRKSIWLYFGGSKITADVDHSHEIKRGLLFGEKVMTNLDSILKKQRHYCVNKGPYSQGYGFSSGHVRRWELDYKESWELKNWCFWTVVLEKTLESPLDCKESQPVQSKEISPGCSLEGLKLKLKFQSFGHLMRKPTHWKRLWERLKVGGEGDNWGWDGWMASLTQWTGVWVNSGSWWWTGRPGMLQSMRSQRVRQDWVTELNWKITAYIHSWGKFWTKRYKKTKKAQNHYWRVGSKSWGSEAKAECCTGSLHRRHQRSGQPT